MGVRDRNPVGQVNRQQEQSLTQTDFKRFRDLIQERSGLYFPQSKQQALARGLSEAMAQSHCADLDAYYRLLQSVPSSDNAWDRLVSLLTVGETYFFRNRGHFDALRKHILPDLIARRAQSNRDPNGSGKNRQLRVWSAGCATGEEPYSIAMLLHELIPNVASWNILILATDINRAALRRAQEGVYGFWSFRGVEPVIQERYFTATGDKQHAIRGDIKRMVTFDYLNLVEDKYPSLLNGTHGMDLILCRNVTIYFSETVTRKVIERFYSSLVVGGWLIPGAAEPNTNHYRAFEHVSFPGAVVYRRSQESTGVPPFQSCALPALQPDTCLPLASRPPAERDPYQAALVLFEAGRVEEALVELYVKLDQAPNFIPTYHTLAKVYAKQGNQEQAQLWCERAIQKDKLHPEPYFTLSCIYQHSGFLDRAIDTLKKTLYLDPTFVLAHYQLANLYQQQRKGELAQRSLRNVQRLLAGKAENELIPEGDGVTVGRLATLVEMAIAGEPNVKTLER